MQWRPGMALATMEGISNFDQEFSNFVFNRSHFPSPSPAHVAVSFPLFTTPQVQAGKSEGLKRQQGDAAGKVQPQRPQLDEPEDVGDAVWDLGELD